MLTTTQITKNRSKLNSHNNRLEFVFQILGDKTRLKLFKLLAQKQELCVSEIAKVLDVSVSAVSQHFHLFEVNGLVDKKRMGQKICYELNLNDPLVQAINNVIILHGNGRRTKKWFLRSIG